MAVLRVAYLTCEYLSDPVAIDEARPRLGWTLESVDPAARGQRQAAYQILVARDESHLARDEGDYWDSGRVQSDQTAQVVYGGRPVPPLHRAYWKVRIWDEAGRMSDWSAVAGWGMGPPAAGWNWPGAWDAVSAGEQPAAALWIAAPSAGLWNDRQSPPSPMFRRAFDLQGPVRRATVYASAMGVYELRLNGQRVGQQVLAPEWTDYRKRTQYQAYEVGDLLRQGPNVIGGMVGPGWYAGQLGLGGPVRGHYGREMRLIVWLEIEGDDGRRQRILSDGSWKCTLDGPITGSDLLLGESYDARREMPGWDRAGYDDSAWKGVAVGGRTRLVAQRNEPIRITRRIRPVSISEPQPGVHVVDLGQNMVGWVRLKLRGAAGAAIRLRHAEVLNEDGTIYRENLRIGAVPAGTGAQQEDHYICRGEKEQVFEPHFTFHGFRYVEVTGLSYRPALDDLEGCVFHSAAPEVGRLECSSPLLNRILSAVQWTQRGNFLSVPTDCPQRDERLGWMGDIQVYSQTAMFNMHMGGFFSKWLQDVRDAQADDGRLPDIAPHPFGPEICFSGNPAWADAGVIIPWRMYVNYGDVRLLEESFESARRYVDWSWRNNPELIWENRTQLNPLWYGDWLNSDTFEELDLPRGRGELDKAAYSTLFFACSADLVARMAGVLGRKEEQRIYADLAGQIREAFRRRFVTVEGKVANDVQAGYALALHFDVLPPELRPLAARHLVEELKLFGGHMSTGIQSTVRLMLELSRWGYSDVAYELIHKTSIPSWGYMIENGATTIWERWDGYVKGRGYQNPGMNSFNHYAIGAVGEWMYRVIGGLAPDEAHPGWKHFIVRPVPGGGLSWAKVEYDSIRGRIACHWSIADGRFRLCVRIPPNTTATVHLPVLPTAQVRESKRPAAEAPGVRALDATTFVIGSGAYEFEAEA